MTLLIQIRRSIYTQGDSFILSFSQLGSFARVLRQATINQSTFKLSRRIKNLHLPSKLALNQQDCDDMDSSSTSSEGTLRFAFGIQL